MLRFLKSGDSYTVDYKLKINFQSLKMLEEKGWFDIAVNRAYYYIYQTFLHYKETKNLNKGFMRFKKTAI